MSFGVLLAFALLPLLALLPHLSQPLWRVVLVVFWGVCGFYWRAQFRRSARCLTQLSYESGCWWLHFPGEGAVSAQLIGERLIWPWFVVLRFRLDRSRERYALLCLPDSAEPDELRRLRVWLRSNPY